MAYRRFVALRLNLLLPLFAVLLLGELRLKFVRHVVDVDGDDGAALVLPAIDFESEEEALQLFEAPHVELAE